MTAAELNGAMPMRDDTHEPNTGSDTTAAVTAEGSPYAMSNDNAALGYENGSLYDQGDREGIGYDSQDGSSHNKDSSNRAPERSNNEDVLDTDTDAFPLKKDSAIDTNISEKGSTPPPEASLAESEEYYEKLMKSDVAELKAEFPELGDLTDIRELNAPIRYAELRDLGLSAAEAYLLTARRSQSDTRGHLSPAFKVGAQSPSGSMTRAELSAARDLFPELSDSEIQRLYRNVTK